MKQNKKSPTHGAQPKINWKQFVTKTLVALLSAAAVTAIAWLGWLDPLDNIVSDAFYQQREATDGEIVVIGMDQRAVDVLGPMPWPRDVMADAIAFLNSDPETAPAVIGIDVLYVGESSDPGADEYLAEVCAEGGNVVVASAATFGSDLVVDVDNYDDFYMNTRAVLAWDSPSPALTEAAATGHINAMIDNDGILRHAMLFIDVPDVGRVKSMPRMLYERWCAATGERVLPEPQTVDGGFFYLPYTTTAGGYYDGVSVLDLLYGEADPEYFAGKLVLIGPYAAGMQDEYRTSIDHAASTYGIEIQANQIDAFRRGFFPMELSAKWQLAILYILCAAVFYLYADRKMLWAVLLWLGVSGGWMLVCMAARSGGVVLHVLWVPLGATVLFIAAVAVNYIRAARERQRVTNTFGHYIDPVIMHHLLEQGSDQLDLGGKLYDVAVLFVDIRGFTTMSESLDPPTVVEIINMYLTLTTECIMKNHGTLDKFVGDCTMAFWNAPLPQKDPVYLACCAAMDMVEGSKALGEELKQRFGRSVSFGVGVHWGPAVIGNIGAPRRMDYTAIGDTVNTASRLESNAPAGTIYISRVVADILGDRAKTTSLGGTIKLKGKAEGFEVLTLDDLER